jgi:hypothetical protein
LCKNADPSLCVQASVDLQLGKLSRILEAILQPNAQPAVGHDMLQASSVTEGTSPCAGQALGSPCRVSGQDASVSNRDTRAKCQPWRESKGRARRQERTANLAATLPGMDSAQDEHEIQIAGRPLPSVELSKAEIESECRDGASRGVVVRRDGAVFGGGSSRESGALGSSALLAAADSDGDRGAAASVGARANSGTTSYGGGGARILLVGVGGGVGDPTDGAVRIQGGGGQHVPLFQGDGSETQQTTTGAGRDIGTQQGADRGLWEAVGGSAPIAVGGGVDGRSRTPAVLLTAESGTWIHAVSRSAAPDRARAATADIAGIASASSSQQRWMGLPGDAGDAAAADVGPQSAASPAAAQGAAAPPWIPTADQREPHGPMSRDGTGLREQPPGGLDTALPGIMVLQHDLASTDGLGRAAGPDDGTEPSDGRSGNARASVEIASGGDRVEDSSARTGSDRREPRGQSPAGGAGQREGSSGGPDALGSDPRG